MNGSAGDRVLEVRDLKICVKRSGAQATILDGVDLALGRSEILGVVGESGSGKSTLCRAIARLLSPDLAVISGTIELGGRDLLSMRSSSVHQMEEAGIAMVFQNAYAALDPLIRVGDQIVEAVQARSHVSAAVALERSVELLSRMGLDDPGKRLRDYPQQFSGGQRQRIVVAIALASDPAVLLADEPTSALDVTTQASILQLFREICSERGTAIVFVSHNYAVVSQVCSNILVLYGGKALERGPSRTLLHASRHPYTSGLIASLPSVDKKVDRLPSIKGSPPTVGESHPGCPFHPRCGFAEDRCLTSDVALKELGGGQASSCIRVDEIWPTKRVGPGSDRIERLERTS
jgi:oligopeptide/dipeptide ABC transporter ATP-binding protein